MTPQTYEVNPGMVLVVPQCNASGGKHVSREVRRDDQIGAGRVTEAETRLVIDDETERDRAEELANQARYLVRARCQYSPLGYVTTRDKLPALLEDLGEVAREASAFNRSARTCRVDATVLTLEIATAITPEVAQAIASRIRSELAALRAAIEAPDLAKLRAVLLRCKNLPDLAVGAQALAIKLALETAQSAAGALKREDPVPDLGELQTAIELFEPLGG